MRRRPMTISWRSLSTVTRLPASALRCGSPNRDFNAKAVARELRQRFEQRNLAEVSDADIREGRLAEVNGWVLPESLAQLCTLAAL